MTPPRVNPPEIDRSLRLSEDQFYGDTQEKSLIVLHHTVGGSAESTVRWWETDPARVGTAYVIARDGTVYEVFRPDYWCWHLGIKNPEMERRSIGIELASEGALVAERNGVGTMLFAFDGTSYKRRLGLADDLLQAGRVVRFEEKWRGYEWFDQYNEPQIISTIRLVSHLMDKFEIPRSVPSAEEWLGPADKRRWHAYRGVIHHCMVRKSKSDLHPGWPLERMRFALQGNAE